MSQRSQAGFTLVELMIVIAIVGILAAVALPAYQGYSTRAKMSEVVLGMSTCRTLISEIYLSGEARAANEWGCESSVASSRYIGSVSTTADGVVKAVATGFNNDEIDGKTIQLVPYKDATTPITATDVGQRVAQWLCGPGSPGVPINYLPATCRERAPGA